MKTLNLDELAVESYPPINVVIDGKTYTIKNISADMLDEVQELGDKTDNRTVCRMLAVLTGTTEGTFFRTDFRKVVRAVKFITETCQEQLNVDPKNSGAGAK